MEKGLIYPKSCKAFLLKKKKQKMVIRQHIIAFFADIKTLRRRQYVLLIYLDPSQYFTFDSICEDPIFNLFLLFKSDF